MNIQVQQLVSELYKSNKMLHEKIAQNHQTMNDKFNIITSQFVEINQRIDVVLQQNQIIMSMLEKNTTSDIGVVNSDMDDTDSKLKELEELTSTHNVGNTHLECVDRLQLHKLSMPNVSRLTENNNNNNNTHYNSPNKKREIDNILDDMLLANVV
jgi:hypothetical protein